jgi:putative glutamine amidotransferase
VPRIAIAPCSKNHDYEESVRRAGGEPTILDLARDPVDQVIGRFDGVLLTGGADVLPSAYGETAHATFKAAEPGRDEYELELVRRALAADLPLLAICRGLQVLNVATGGTLVQDIPSEVPNAVHHDVREPRVAIAHDVWMTAGTLLERLMRDRVEEGDEINVNSRHHQAAKQLGASLVVSGTAPDGVIEAVEAPSYRFCLGVQWHPENFYRTGEFSPLFEGLVAAARIVEGTRR